jgi:hypothetical protein
MSSLVINPQARRKQAIRDKLGLTFISLLVKFQRVKSKAEPLKVL